MATAKRWRHHTLELSSLETHNPTFLPSPLIAYPADMGSPVDDYPNVTEWCPAQLVDMSLDK